MTIPYENPIAKLCESVEGSLFGDKRIDRRAIKLLETMVEKCHLVIRQLAHDAAEQKAYRALLRNPKMRQATVVESLQAQCHRVVRDGHILAINDTTEINLQAQVGRVRAEELGVIGDGKSLGFFLHPTLVLCVQTGEALGLSSVQSWTRPETKPNKHERDYKRQAIAEKESYKWLRAAQETKAVLAEADMITMIADRESDIYEEFATVPDERTHLLVRCCHDRCLVDGKTKLYQTLQQQELAGSYSLSLPADKRKGRKQREAKLEVRFCQVKLKRPSTLGNDYPNSVTRYAVEARECQETIAEGEEAIHWRLLSSHEVDSYEKALQLIIWYSWRFFIEQLFRTLKRQGLELEATELESGKAIIKLAIFGLHAALRVMQLVRARDGSEQAVDVAFTAEEQACLADLAPRLEGSTGKQANPHPLASLAWASWLIARLGGWNGYASERPAGVITMYRGLKQFQAIFLGWQLARENDG